MIRKKECIAGWSFGVALLVSACCPGSAPWCPVPGKKVSETIGAAVRNVGYIPLANPDNNYQRGAVIAVRTKNPFSGDIVCSWDQLFSGLPLLPSVNGVAQEWQEQTQESLSVDVTAINKINASLNVDAVRSIKVSFTNPITLDLTDTDAFAAASHPSSVNCVSAIRARLAAKQDVTLINSSIGADASYTIDWKDGLDASVKATLTPQIAAQLAASLSTTGSGTLTGTGLVYGVTDSTYLLETMVAHIPQSPGNTASIRSVLSNLAAQVKVRGDSLLNAE